jgi:hypothetical protein
MLKNSLDLKTARSWLSLGDAVLQLCNYIQKCQPYPPTEYATLQFCAAETRPLVPRHRSEIVLGSHKVQNCPGFQFAGNSQRGSNYNFNLLRTVRWYFPYLHFYYFTNQLHDIRILPLQLIIIRSVPGISSRYETRMFIAIITKARLRNMFDPSIPLCTFKNNLHYSYLMLTSHLLLGIPSDLFSGERIRNFEFINNLSSCMLHAHSISTSYIYSL